MSSRSEHNLELTFKYVERIISMQNFQPSCKCIGLHIYNTSKAVQIGQIRLAVGEKGIFPFDWENDFRKSFDVMYSL